MNRHQKTKEVNFIIVNFKKGIGIKKYLNKMNR